MYGQLARATVQIICGESNGSGFHFRREDIVITNHHVIHQATTNGTQIFAVTEDGDKFPLELLTYSPQNEFDFAILQANEHLPDGRTKLIPKIGENIERGKEVLFSGFPHGIPDLLVQRAIVSAVIDERAFYIDGSVNGGNSGGPIIDYSDGSVIGIVTQRRFLGGVELDDLSNQAQQLYSYCQQIAGRGSVQIMGIDFGQFAGSMSQSFILIDQILKANANSGIGIGFRIDFANDKYVKVIGK
jgi:hypothetical protein